VLLSCSKQSVSFDIGLFFSVVVDSRDYDPAYIHGCVLVKTSRDVTVGGTR